MNDVLKDFKTAFNFFTPFGVARLANNLNFFSDPLQELCKEQIFN